VTAPAPAGLDNPVAASLSGAHAQFAAVHGPARRYRPEYSLFASVEDPQDPSHFAALAELLGEDLAIVAASSLELGGHLEAGFSLPGFQMLGDEVAAAPFADAELLGVADAAEALALATLAQPGPFSERTIELGTFVGVRDGRALVAMAGTRFDLGGIRELSGVATDPAYRGRGLARSLVRHLLYLERDAGRELVLHVAETNLGAIALYEQMGFRHHQVIHFAQVHRPS